MDWLVSTLPALEPVTLTEAKLHLRVDITADDDLITELIKSARIWCEGFQNRAYITQSITARLDTFSDTMEMPQPRLISVTSIKYTDTAGVEQTVAASVYNADITSEPGLITLAYEQSWPNIRTIHHAIEIIYTAGYGAAASDVPEHVKSAMKLLIGHLYENRETVTDIAMQTIPMGVKSLLYIDRVF